MASTAMRPSGPKGHWLTGNLAEFHKDILGFYTRLAHDYGDCVPFRLGRRPMLLVNDPKVVEQILVSDAKKFAKLTYVLKLIVPLLGQGLLTSDGSTWLRQRRLIQPAFSQTRIASYAPMVVEYTERMVERWTDGQEIDVHQEMMRLTLEIVAKVLFDADVGGDAGAVGDALTEVMVSFLDRWGSFLPLPNWLPTPGNRRFQRAIRRLDEIIFRFIDERRKSADLNDRSDLLSQLLAARDEDDGGAMSDRQLRDEVMTLFLAGHETTAAVLSFTLYLLGKNPEVAEKLDQELSTVLYDRTATIDDVPRLKYTEAVVKEAMRLYPPAYAFGRLMREDCELGGFPTPAGTTILISQWVLHRDARWWNNPELCQPERWLDGSTDELPKFAYLPFGGGARRCIGDAFAMVESVLVLAVLSRRVRLRLTSNQPPQLRPAVTLRPESAIKARVELRTPASN